MPNRVIRDAVLDSPRYHALSSDSARLLFMEMLLLVDDYGLTPAYPLFLARRTSVARRATDEAITTLVSELADHDLVRIYEVKGQRYAYLPRFGNWPRAKKPKWPIPPDEMGGNEIKDLQQKRSASTSQPLANAPETETETETETDKDKNTCPQGEPADHCPHQKIIALYHEKLPSLPRCRAIKDNSRKASTRDFWKWVMRSKRSDGTRRAANEQEALAWIAGYFGHAADNDFLMGRLERGGQHKNWRCDFDFLLTERGMKHVIEKTETTE